MTYNLQRGIVALLAPMMACAALLLAPAAAHAQSTGDVFAWTDVPQNTHIQIVRATFDEGGYQLYDTIGEVILVPFRHNNLYVMKFGVSHDGTMFFVNHKGINPALFVPPGGYLENATVSGAVWYPFPSSFQPAHPVYLGIAPSWSDYVGMGWYDGMVVTGGYYGSTPFTSGGVFVAMAGLSIAIGGVSYGDWNGYNSYWHGHGGYNHVGYVNRGYYSSKGGFSKTVQRTGFAGTGYAPTTYTNSGRPPYTPPSTGSRGSAPTSVVRPIKSSGGAVSGGQRTFVGGQLSATGSRTSGSSGGRPSGGSGRTSGGSGRTSGGGGRSSGGGGSSRQH